MHLIALVLACAGSGTDPNTDPTTPSDTGPVVIPDLDPALSLGTGVDAFEEVADGDDIVIVYGPQGGYHLDGSLRVQGINPGDPKDLSNPDNPLTTFEVLDELGDPISGLDTDTLIEYRQGIDDSDELGVYEMLGRRIFLDIPSDNAIEDQMLTVTVTVEDIDGVVVQDSHSLRAVPHPLN